MASLEAELNRPYGVEAMAVTFVVLQTRLATFAEMLKTRKTAA
jgi:hypothetical protein